MELTTLEWVAWFDKHRLLQAIGYISPAEAEANYYGLRAEQVAVAACLNQSAFMKTGPIQVDVG